MMVENEFLAFEWPSFIAWQSPEGGGPPVAPMLRSQRPIPTWVGVRFEPLEGQPNRTRVTLSHYGFQNGEIWDESRKYFWTAWPSVLGRLGSIFVTDGQAVAANDQ